ncbi:class I SAM-dependent methyltransferase [Plebeiibacterium sediminum]|uniref:Class I SAM-dependent methyltransferase n=1 Tax=Plebeiibacterium sediminum TaxID=2992112 RepID=A0AAE3M1J8_9BACT|nr:class I SAM-dependent methyltransferase [Plebeiobacterium sediminum]MCW3785019.1 class I SAM-dependent methyltransferase [Plebeiobacterium sediminum]
MKEFWNDRFSSDNYIYGVDPNVVLKDFIDRNKPGVILFPGEGEGRNIVYAAQKGWSAKAIDQSDKGKDKALKLALKNNVNIDYSVDDILTFDYKSESFDAIALVFFHLPEILRKKIHKHLISLLKPNGKIFIVGFTKEQLKYSSGGPKDVNMLYSEELLYEDFRGLEVIKCVTEEMELDEGPGHQGVGSVIEFEAVKN